MKTARSNVGAICETGVLILVLLCAAQLSAAAQAAYAYNTSQVSPDPALTSSHLAAILNQTALTTAQHPALDQYQQTTTSDATGAVTSLAPLKVVQTDDPAHPYLGVFHNQVTATKFATYAAYSTDLVHWHTLGMIDNVAAGEYGSQPDIRILSDDSVLFAEEYNPAHRPQIRVRHYGTTGGQTGLRAFIANAEMTPTFQKVLPNINMFSKADGTPEFGRISYTGSILNSEIEITHHYFNFGQRDNEAVGTLTNAQQWTNTTDTTINTLVTNAGGNGDIGDRELFEIGSIVYEVVEAQVNPISGNDYSSWRVFLINRTTDTIQRLSPALAGGAQSLGNPTVSFITLPNGGGPALIFTCFIFDQDDGGTPPGGHMYVYPLANLPN